MTAAADPESRPLRVLLWGLSPALREQAAKAVQQLGLELTVGPRAQVLVADAAKLATLGLDPASFVHVVAVLPGPASGGTLAATRPTLRSLDSGPEERPPRVDVLIEGPAGHAAFAHAISKAPAIHPDATALAPISLLGADLDEALDRAARLLLEANGARSAVVALPRHERFGLAGEALDEAGQRRLRIAISRQAPVVDEGGLTHIAAPLSGDDEAWLGLVVAAPPRACGTLIDTLEQLAGRLSAELTWRALHDRVVNELDAQRAAGGIDPVLGVWTPEAFRRLLRMAQSASRRSGRPLSVGVLDVVGMTGINDRYGHVVGDALLAHLATTTVHVLRDYDGVTRHEGDALAILFDGCAPADAVRALERIKAASCRFALGGGEELTVTLAAGVSSLGASPDEVDQVLVRATAASRESAAGRAEVVVSAGDGELVASAGPSIYGMTLGGIYRLIHQVGVGGGGSVYRAEDLSLRRPVAVKILSPELAGDETLLERFREEAATLAALRHPHLVQVYAFGVDGETAFFVMELVEGESVMHAIQRCIRERHRLPYAKVGEIVRQTASALEALHGAGVTHRDVKPDNILLDPFRGRAVLADVGIARKHGGDVFLAGTPGYVAPEATHDPYVGRTADVYGLAVTAYEMLFLQLPWPVHDDPLVMVRYQSTLPPTPPSELAPELAALDEILLRGFHPDPNERWSTAAELADALVQQLALVDPKVAPSSRGDVSMGVAPTLPLRVPVDEVEVPASTPSAREVDVQALSRGLFFRTITRVIGVRETALWREALETEDARLAEVLSSDLPPLGWYPTDQLDALLVRSPGDRAPEAIGRDLGRAVVRTSFRRFFPASPATLSPIGTLGVLGRIWRDYHRWGVLEVTGSGKSGAIIRIEEAPRSTAIFGCVVGMIEALVQLSGGRDPLVEEIVGDQRGKDTWSVAVRWA